LEGRLETYDRTRDFRFAEERTEADANAWTDVVRSYVGDQFPAADDV
jgi:light-regulated signal transduction histidine kinase (bacteriophytochrome)